MSDGSQSSQLAIEKLLLDEATRDLILDQEELRSTLADSIQPTHISQRLFFYLHVRHEFIEAGISDPAVADYVAEVLANFSETENWRPISGCEDSQSIYLFEIIAKMPVADEFERFVLNAHLGNYVLTLLGLFKEHVEQRRNRKAAPSPSYYEGMAAQSFLNARDHRMAQKLDLEDVFDALGTGIKDSRRALNQMTETTLFVGNE